MAELKTRLNDGSVHQFLDSIDDEKKRKDSYTILKYMSEISGSEAKMWGASIVGFGNYHYKYKSGREGDWFLCGFSPRKQALTLYIMSGFKKYQQQLAKLGKYKTGKSCLYIKHLEDIDHKVLKDLVKSSVEYLKEKKP